MRLWVRLRLAAVLVCAAAVGAACGQAALATPTTAMRLPAHPPASVPAPTGAPYPTATPIPTDTPAPTATPQPPTATPTAIQPPPTPTNAPTPVATPTAAATASRAAPTPTAAAPTQMRSAPASQPSTCPSGCATPPPGCAIKGNINSSGEKIYHLPGQSNYTATIIDASKGERWFCTEDEAVANGWRKSKS